MKFTLKKTENYEVKSFVKAGMDRGEKSFDQANTVLEV